MSKILIDEALRLADALEDTDGAHHHEDAAAELRRLHAENQALRQALKQPAPPECKTEAEKTAYAFGWWKALESVREQPIAQAVHTLIQAMQDDPEYAWSWHCNIAMAFVDAGGDRYTANQGAARFLELFAKVPPAHELPAQEPDPDELTIAYMSGIYEGKKHKPWVGLTDEEMRALKQKMVEASMLGIVTDFEYIRSIEAKLKGKNQ